MHEPSERNVTASCPVFGMGEREQSLLSPRFVEQRREPPWKGRTRGEAASPVQFLGQRTAMETQGNRPLGMISRLEEV